eukprot:TRINITY_DN14182_c0_g1_i1.p2 TRINITY_DN14182_c0_g1~~TRINITY_DN14182_c0_g1_i1.p2  ORF type:complete len:99 (+),score=21.09 TRINITY_DN14182_c0_g1_i1:85-381(+)
MDDDQQIERVEHEKTFENARGAAEELPTKRVRQIPTTTLTRSRDVPKRRSENKEDISNTDGGRVPNQPQQKCPKAPNEHFVRDDGKKGSDAMELMDDN